MKELPDFYLVEELAKKLRINPMTIYRYIKAGKIEAYKTGKEYRIARLEFDRFLEAAKHVNGHEKLIPNNG